tara:strand:+ start:958 stop:1140 length:183 start_codon:yes stop_codon:yes gene_type:complete
MMIKAVWICEKRLYKATHTHPKSWKQYTAYKPRPFEAAIEAYKIAASVESWLQKREDKGA